MMLAVQFADFGFGTVVGAVVAGSIAIFLDQRRRKDEKKTRWQENKQRAYKNFLHFSDLMVNDLVLIATLAVVLGRLDELDIDPSDIEDVKQLNAWNEEALSKGEKHFPQFEERSRDAVADFALFAPKSTAEAARKLMHEIGRIAQHIFDDENEKAAALKGEYLRARSEFAVQARRDLGTDA
jgi:hypothetical protein